jgi:hypothetical protein
VSECCFALDHVEPVSGGIFKDAYQGASGILAGSPGSRLETLLTKAHAYAVVIVIVAALICALSAVVVAVSPRIAARGFYRTHPSFA